MKILRCLSLIKFKTKLSLSYKIGAGESNKILIFNILTTVFKMNHQMSFLQKYFFFLFFFPYPTFVGALKLSLL